MALQDEEELAPRRAELAARGRLGLLLRRRARARMTERGIELRFRADQSLGHLAESLGIPRLEIGAALVDGSPWPLDLSPPDGSFAELFPLEEPLRLDGEPRFLLDLHLGRLARILRLLGFDALWRSDDEGAAFDMLRQALAGERILLTRDRALLFRRELHDGSRRAMLVLSPQPYEQLLEVARRFELAPRLAPFSRCADCGGGLRPASREEVRLLVPAIVGRRYDEFFLCPGCGKAYWKGDHFRNIEPLLARLRADLGAV